MKANSTVTVGSGPRAVVFANDAPLALIAGPCQMESRDHAFMMAEKLAEICDKARVRFVFKAVGSLRAERKARLPPILPMTGLDLRALSRTGRGT